MIRSTKLRRPLLAVVVLAVGFYGFQRWSQWHDTPLKPLWTDLQKNEGFIHSIASGRNPQGTEVIVAAGYLSHLRVVSYAAADGKVLWERRFRNSHSGIGRKYPTVIVDRSGDVLIGWMHSDGEHNTDPEIEKLSGMDGHTLWTWTAEVFAKHQTRHAAIPKPDAFGRVWVTGIQPYPELSSYTRYLALLDSATGKLLWKHLLNPASDCTDRMPVLHSLANGDALVFVPPWGNSDDNPGTWLLQRISCETGRPIWERTFPRKRNCEIFPPSVDAERDQVIVRRSEAISMPNAPDRAQMEFTSFRLGDGGELWSASQPLVNETLGYGVSYLRKTGSLAIFETKIPEPRHKLWDFVDDHLPQWMWKPKPRSGYQSFQNLISTRDGSPLSRSKFGKDNDFPEELLTSPNQAHAALLVRGEIEIKPDTDEEGSIPSRQDTYRIAPLNERSSAPTRSIFRQQIIWTGTTYLTDRFIITDSGKIVMIGDPMKEFQPGWEVRVWE